MGFLEKLKNIFKEEHKEEKAVEIRKINLEEIPKVIEGRTKENSDKEKKIKEEIVAVLHQFYEDIDESQEILEKADPSKRKEQEKIKLIVQENLNLYKNYLHKLVLDLKETEELDTHFLLTKVTSILHDFHKKSHIVYEKATYLIGNEMAHAKNNVLKLTREFDEIVRQNKHIFEEKNELDELNSFYKEIDEISRQIEEIDSVILRLNDSLIKSDEEKGKTEKEIIEIKSGAAYKKEQQEKEENYKRLQKLNDELQSVKQGIDFKLLAKIYHSNEQKSNLIKEYQNNFKMTMEKDANFELLDMVKDTQGLDLEYLKDVINKIKEYETPTITKTDEKIMALEEDLRKFESGKNSISESLKEEEKKKEKIAKKREEIFLKIKESIEEIFHDIELVS